MLCPAASLQKFSRGKPLENAAFMSAAEAALIRAGEVGLCAAGWRSGPPAGPPGTRGRERLDPSLIIAFTHKAAYHSLFDG